MVMSLLKWTLTMMEQLKLLYLSATKGVRSRRLSRHFLTKITEVGVRGELHEKNRFFKGAYIFDTNLSQDAMTAAMGDAMMTATPVTM
jgi:hypothetical protein